jgi:UDP-glucose 4-epimerase
MGEVVCLDNFDPTYDPATKKTNIEPFLKHENFELVVGDIQDKELLVELVKDIDYIFHEAALVSVAESMRDPVKTIEINTIGTFNVLDAALSGDVKKVMLASSAAVYGDSPELPKKEDMTPAPKSPYAISKLDCEYAAKMYYEEYGLKTTSLRYFNVYGPRQDPTSPYAAAVPIFIRKALRNEDIIIHGDGTQTRDLVFVKDVVRVNELAISKGDGGGFNVASGKSVSINELAELVIELTGSKSEIVYGKSREGDIKHSVADIAEIEGIGLEGGVGLREGIGEAVKWFGEQEANI